MDTGIRAELAIRNPSVCQVAASASGERVDRIVRSSTPTEGVLVEDFSVNDSVTIPDGTRVFEGDAETRYRITRESDQPCVCACIESHGVPVEPVAVEEGTLVVELYVEQVERVSEIVTDLKESFEGVLLRRLTRTGVDNDSNLMFVDRSVFTDRQQCVLETAHQMGYFDYPKRANAGEVAKSLDISRSTFTEHLSAAQSKLIDSLVGP